MWYFNLSGDSEFSKVTSFDLHMNFLVISYSLRTSNFAAVNSTTNTKKNWSTWLAGSVFFKITHWDSHFEKLSGWFVFKILKQNNKHGILIVTIIFRPIFEFLFWGSLMLKNKTFVIKKVCMSEILCHVITPAKMTIWVLLGMT